MAGFILLTTSKVWETFSRQQKNMELYGLHAPKRRNANVQPNLTKYYAFLKIDNTYQ